MTTKSQVREQETAFYDDEYGDLISRVYSARGISSKSELCKSLKSLISYKKLFGVEKAAEVLVESILAGEKIVIIGDFDTDGSTSTALLLRFFKQIEFSSVSYIIPSRFGTGYGLSNELIDFALSEHSANVIVTVDNGITAISEVEYAKSKGLKVVITDHHQVSELGLPKADVIVNPNQPDCTFPSKNLAGVGVAFYLLIALRAKLREKHYFEAKEMPDPNLAEFLDLVALGTVADMVPLDQNNRILVHQGLLWIRKGTCSKGISSLLAVGQKNQNIVSASDLSYSVAPKINAAGRIANTAHFANTSPGVDCLVAESYNESDKLAEKLNDLNMERREIEAEMQKSAQEILAGISFSQEKIPLGLCMYDESWHQGVSGILASRIKDSFKRPVVVFAKHIQQDVEEFSGELKGSARSIKHVDVREILAKINADNPGIINKFGGHKAAAGLSISLENYEKFRELFETYVSNQITEDDCYEELMTDGELPDDHFNLDFASYVRDCGPWGIGFPEPVFEGSFKIMEQRIVGQKHLKLSLHPKGGYDIISAICFNIDQSEWLDYGCTEVRLVYRLDISEYKGNSVLQLVVLNIEKVQLEVEVGIEQF